MKVAEPTAPRLIDTCVHHRWDRVEEVLEYLDPGWRGYVGTPASLPGGAGMRQWVPRLQFVNPSGDDLLDAVDENGRSLASSVDRLAAAFLDPGNVDRALLLFDRGMFVPAGPNPHLALTMVRAINDWNLDRWLSRDERLYGAVLVPSQIPEDAAVEIARVGGHEKIAAVLLAAPALGKTLGHPIYDPIYRAAAELELPVVIHRGGDAVVDIPTGPAGGSPSTFAEYAALAPFGLITQLISVIANGVLDKYPSLRLFVVGAGVTWLPGFLMRFELIYRALRREVPWVRRQIDEYFERQIRVGTYGLERGAGSRVLTGMIGLNPEFASWLAYGSGFPSWDTASQEDVRTLFPRDWHERVLVRNAESWFRWPAFMPLTAGAV